MREGVGVGLCVCSGRVRTPPTSHHVQGMSMSSSNLPVTEVKVAAVNFVSTQAASCSVLHSFFPPLKRPVDAATPAETKRRCSGDASSPQAPSAAARSSPPAPRLAADSGSAARVPEHDTLPPRNNSMPPRPPQWRTGSPQALGTLPGPPTVRVSPPHARAAAAQAVRAATRTATPRVQPEAEAASVVVVDLQSLLRAFECGDLCCEELDAVSRAVRP